MGSLDQVGQSSQEVEEGMGSLDLARIVLAEEDQNRDHIVELGSTQEICVGEDGLEEERVIRRGSEAAPVEAQASKNSAYRTLVYFDLHKVVRMSCERSLQSEGRQRKYRHGFAHSVQVCD